MNVAGSSTIAQGLAGSLRAVSGRIGVFLLSLLGAISVAVALDGGGLFQFGGESSYLFILPSVALAWRVVRGLLERGAPPRLRDSRDPGRAPPERAGSDRGTLAARRAMSLYVALTATACAALLLLTLATAAALTDNSFRLPIGGPTPLRMLLVVVSLVLALTCHAVCRAAGDGKWASRIGATAVLLGFGAGVSSPFFSLSALGVSIGVSLPALRHLRQREN